ncbi:alpha-(1-_3)-arabinofuranosyltransferase domain-containing protein [Amycolatopsis sp. NPDC003865]
MASRWWLIGVWALMFVLFAAGSPGKTTFDTKLGVNVDPAGFYAQLGHLWNPLQWFGGVQNQAIGYAFPMGAFSWLGQVVHLPVWLTERLWMSLLVAAGFWGLVRLAETLRVGNPATRLLAGAVFALWPTYTILVGSTSAAVLPGLLAAWAVRPLVRGARAGSVPLAACRSGVAVLFMGGVNAASTIAALVLPVCFLLTRKRDRRLLSLALWWVFAVVLATAWWALPLVLQAAYGFDFLPFIEQAANTTQTTSAAAVLRGSGNWVAYLHFGNAWLAAGWAVVSTPLLIGASAVAAAVGLAGLARRDLPEGRWLRLSAGLAALVLLVGYAGPAGGLFGTAVQHWLDGALAPFRNVYKFEPVLAVATALGIAHALVRRLVARRVRARRAVVGRVFAVLVAAAVLIGLGQPYLTGRVLQSGSFAALPSYWHDAADFLAERSPNSPALVTPADSHGTYTWGTPVDEPLEALAKSPWVQRTLVPYSGAGSQVMVRAAEDALESGSPQPGLAAYLARAGVHYVVVRNDLDPTQLDYVSPDVIHETLLLSGFTRAASFGPETTGGYAGSGEPATVAALLRQYPAVEVFEARGAAAGGPVVARSAESAVQVDGDPGSLLQLANQGVLGDRAVVMNGDAGPVDRPATEVLTDGMRRRDTAFGLIRDNLSYTYTAGETNPPDDPHGAGGAEPRQLVPDYADGHQTVAELGGAAAVTASSYGSWLWRTPQYDPVNAFDGDPATAWTSGTPAGATGQWLRIDFQHPTDLPAAVPVRLLDDSTLRPLIQRAVVTTDSGSATTELAATGASQPLRVPAGRASWLRITIDRTAGGVAGLGAGIRDIAIAGVKVTRYLHAAGAGTPAVISFHRDATSPWPLGGGQPEPQLARTFDTGSAENVVATATAVATPGAALDALLERTPAAKPAVQASASSSWGALPQFRAANLVDGNWRTPWVAGGPDPVVHLSWSGARRIDELAIVPASGVTATPTKIRIAGTDGTREVAVPNTSTTPVPSTGDVKFPALTTDHLDISFPELSAASTGGAALGPVAPPAVGVAELYVPALADLISARQDTGTPVDLPCGQGPDLVVDGHTYPTSAKTTTTDLTDFRPIVLGVCADEGTLPLAAGRHVLSSAGGPGPLVMTDLTLSTVAAAAGKDASESAGRSVGVLSWGPERRQVAVSAGTTSYLQVHEAFNSGWTASLDGKPLTPVELDGWQQGFVLPEGSGGTVTLSFPPGTVYRVALVVAGAAVVGLILAALVEGIRRRRQAPARIVDTEAGAGRSGVWAALVAVTALLVVVGGFAAVLVPILAALAYVKPRWMPIVAAVAMLGAGAFAVAGVAWHGVALGDGSFGGPAQVLALAALAAALTPHLPRRGSVRS